MSGKKGKAPCGHPGTFATNTFITCDRRCDFEDFDNDVTPTLTLQELFDPFDCPKCCSLATEPFPTQVASGLYHCLPCGNVFKP